jgi:hypothetical protein
VTVDDPALEAKLQAVREGTEYRVALTYSPTGRETASIVRRMLTLTTDDPRQPIFKIPVTVLLPRKPPGAARDVDGASRTAGTGR